MLTILKKNTSEAICLIGRIPTQPHKMDRGLKLQIWYVEGLYYLCKENKDTDQLYTAQLICTFVENSYQTRGKQTQTWFRHITVQITFMLT